jgi:hypothetical protein
MAPTTSLPQLPPAPLKAIARGFMVLLPYSLTLISSIYPPPTCNPTTVPVLQSCLSLLISKLMFKGVSCCIPVVSLLYFDQFHPFHCSSLPLPSHAPFLTAFNNSLIAFIYTDVIYYDIFDTQSFLFTFPPSPSSRE